MRCLPIVFIVCFLLISAFVFAGGKPGSIQGVVKLTDGKPAAYVSLIIKGSKRGAVANEEGAFEFHGLASGVYELEVSLAGYETIAQSVTVHEDAIANVVFVLHLSEKQLDEVIVKTNGGYQSGFPSSALRLNEPLSEVPQNIQLVTNKMFADQQIASMSDGITRNVSGVTRLEHWGDLYTRINMRGGRASAFRNGMNVTSNWGPLTEDLSFVDRIEFVKGPAGFMMSNGDPSGIYNVVTKRPTGQTKGEVNFMPGSYNFYRSAIDLDGKLSKDGKILYRLNVMGQTKNSFRPYEYNNRYSIAPVISYKIADNTTLTAEYILQHAKMSDVGSYYVFSTKGYGGLPRNFTTMPPALDPTVINDQSVTLNLQHNFGANWKITAQAANFNYQQKGSSLWPSSIDSAGNMIRSVSIWDASNVSKFGQVYLNGDLQTGVIHHRLLGGLDVGDKEYMADWNQSHNLDSAGAYFNVFAPDYGTPANGYPVWDRSKSLRQRAGQYGIVTQQYTGIYFQDELGFFKNALRLTIAGRYTAVKQNNYNTFTNGRRFTPRAGVSVSVDKQTSVYALFDQSFDPQSGIRRDGKTVVPVTGNNTEIGLKKDWKAGRWSTSISAYRILQNNQTSADPSNSANEYYVVQFGQTKTQGIELDVRGQLLPGLQVVANYALNDSKISKADTANKATIGNKVPGYAKHTANAWLGYKLRNGALKGLGINAGFTYLVDRTTWSWGASGQKRLPDYFKLDGGLTYEQNQFTITANVYNLLNQYLYSGAYYGYGGFYYWQAEAGRNVRLSLAYRF